MSSLIDLQTRSPRAYDQMMGDDVWATLSGIDPRYAPLIKGTAGCSPYLSGLLTHETDWLAAALDAPQDAIETIISQLTQPTLEELPHALRKAKRRMALIIALADLAGAWELPTVTATLSRFASACVDASLKGLIAAEVAHGKIPGMSEDDIVTACGMVVLAMGKMGADELNYSSDIDLICLFDETRFDPADYHDARSAFIRVTRKMTAILSDTSFGGYVFRTDLRLRPDPSVTPVCVSMDAAERYYESVGRTWERAAYIKAHPVAGDIAAGARFLDTLRPFVWRKHLDFAAIQDAHDMRQRIRDHKGLHGPLVLEGHNMKLGRGGIREIEFFTQTRQLIAGGRDPSLRGRGTKQGLSQLAASGWIPEETGQILYHHYAAHREVEHRLQMINDAQTHDLPTSPEGFGRLAAFMGQETVQLRRDIKDRLEEVHELTEGFFAPEEPRVDVPSQDWAQETTDRWPTYPALRSDRAVQSFDRLLPGILAHLQEAAAPEEALREFDGFLRGLPAGVQLFALFEANPQLTRMIVDIAATAPALAQYLSRNASVFDAVIGGAFFDPWPDQEALKHDLQTALDECADYESLLIRARTWAKEWHFRIGVHHLRGLIDAQASAQQYAALAECVLSVLWPHVIAEFSHKHGDPPGLGAIVLAMGSLGARQLHASSDLDLIVIYDAPADAMSQGPRPLATRPYYARLTQALITAISAPMVAGRLYEVDMRLRPSGRQGPVATSYKSFCDYQMSDAWTWEHLALTRARAVAGPEPLADLVEVARKEIIAQKGQQDTLLADVADMRRRLRAEKPPDSLWDAKLGAGRLQDCALFVQTAALRGGDLAQDPFAQLQAGVADGWLSAADAGDITEALGLFWRLQAAARLLTGRVLEPETIGQGGLRFVLRETEMETADALSAALSLHAAKADAIITRMLSQSEAIDDPST